MDTIKYDEYKFEDSFEEKLEGLKEYPFDLKQLEEIAQNMTGDSKIKLVASNQNFMAFRQSKKIVYVPIKYINTHPNDNYDGLSIIAELIHELEGHYKLTNHENIHRIIKFGEKDGLSPNVSKLLFNAIEDARINQVLIDEEAYSYTINYIYKKSWNIHHVEDINPEQNWSKTIQFAYNIIYFWRNGKYLEGTNKTVEKALDASIEAIYEAIYTPGIKESDYSMKEDYNKARSERSFRVLCSQKLWDNYKKLFYLDNEALNSNNEEIDRSKELIEQYTPKDSQDGQESKEKNKNAIYEISPALRGNDIYCANYHTSDFDSASLTWNIKENKKKYLDSSEIIGEKYVYRFSHPGKNKAITIPLARDFVVDFNSIPENTEVYISENGNFSMSSLNAQNIDLIVGRAAIKKDLFNQKAKQKFFINKLTAKTHQLMQDLKKSYDSNINIALRLQKHFQKKSYSSKNQGSLREKSQNVSDYLYNIDKEEGIECYSANTLATALCRELNIATRLVLGFRPDLSTKNTQIFSNDAHAWTEIWHENSWNIVDFTPNNQSNENSDNNGNFENEPYSDLEKAARQANENFEQADEISKEQAKKISVSSDKNSENNVENFANSKSEKKERKTDNAQNKLDLDKSIAEKIYERASNIIKDVLKKIIDQIEIDYNVSSIKRSLKKEFDINFDIYSGLNSGTRIARDSNSLKNAVLGSNNIWERVIYTEEKEEIIEMLDAELVIAVDCSKSMKEMTDLVDTNYLSTLDHAFLQVLTLAKIAAHFEIPFHVILFSDRVQTINIDPYEWTKDGELDEELAIKELTSTFLNFDRRGNAGNMEAVKSIIDILEKSEQSKKLALLVSDGDISDQRFFDKEGDIKRKMKDFDIYLLALGYGDAIKKDPNNFVYKRKELRFIEARFFEAPDSENYGFIKGVPIKDFENSDIQVGKILYEFISSQHMPQFIIED